MNYKQISFEEVSTLVAGLSIDRAHDAKDWLSVGFAIHSVDDSERGFELWETFSKRSEAKYTGDCRTRWRSFKPEKTGGITVATLKMMYSQDTGHKLNGDKHLTIGSHKNINVSLVSRPKLTENSPVLDPPSNKLWRTANEARAIYLTLPWAGDDPSAQAFFSTDYGLTIDQIPIDWKVFEHPTLKTGIVYTGEAIDSQIVYKFKSLKRDEKSKRDVRFLYGGAGAMVLGSDPLAPWVIVAGEEKAAAAASAGYNVLCPMTGESTLGSEWVSKLAQTSIARIILANDNDEAGRKANESTARELSSASFPRLRLYELEWPNGAAEGYDLNDLQKTGDLEATLANSLPIYQGMSSLSLLQVLQLEFPEDDNLLDDRALALGELSAIIGPGGIGKSAMAFDLAVSMIMGWDWAGMQTYGQGKRWLFFQTENNARRLKSNFAALTRGKTIDDICYISDRLITITPLTDLDSDVALNDLATVQKMKAEVHLHQPEIIVFDPLIDFFAGDNENDAMHMRNTLQAIREICRSAHYPVCPLIIHHSRIGEAANKGSVGMDAGAYGRGSKALYSAVRSQINISKGDEEEECPVLIVSHAKANNGARFKPRAVKLDPGSMTYPIDHSFNLAGWREEMAKGKGKGRPSMLDESAILCRLEDGQEHPQKQVAESVVEAWKVSIRTVYNLISKMEQDNKINIRKEKVHGGTANFIRLIS